MKKKVGELYDKPIVIGNPNEFTKNEIPLKTLTNSEGGSQMLYFDITNLYDLFTSTVLGSAQLFKTYRNSGTANRTEIRFHEVTQSAYTTTAVGFCTTCRIPRTVGGEVKLVNPIEYLISEYGSLDTLAGLKQITEEEFYTI
jgi:hypothetical protein